MLSIVLTIFCFGVLAFAIANQIKTNSLISENSKVNKSNLGFKTDFIKMSKDIENLINVSHDLNKTNSILKKRYDSVLITVENQNKTISNLNKTILKLNTTMNTLNIRIKDLENDNRKIKTTLENHKLMAVSMKVNESFAIKMVK